MPGRLLFPLVLGAALSASAEYRACATGEWTRVDFRKDVKAGSALDFSFLVEAPAGKYGRLKAVGDHFEFERRPGVAQRFRGINLVGPACFPTGAELETLLTRLVRLGYNSIRLIHHDGRCLSVTTNNVATVSETRNLDELFALAEKKGLYVTFDLHVSRPVLWKTLGVDLPGRCERDTFKRLVPLYRPAFDNWAAGARAILTRVNPLTGRRYADEPALACLSLINEGGWMLSWNPRKVEPVFRSLWDAWLTQYREKHPGAFPELGADGITGDLWQTEKSANSAAFAIFEAEAEKSFMRRARAFLADELGCKVPLTDQNWGPGHLPMAGTRATDFDYVDTHFYVSHPYWEAGRSWQLPCRFANHNPFYARSHRLPTVAFNRVWDKPFTLTEYALCAPLPSRSASGLMIGSFAALQDWSGIWRFSYSHVHERMFTDEAPPHYFDLAADPVACLSEYAAATLYLRGDLKPAQTACLALLDRDALEPSGPEAFRAPAEWTRGLMWKARVGCTRTPDGAKGAKVLPSAAVFGPAATNEVTAAPDPQIAFGATRATFTVVTPRTVGGFVPAADVPLAAGPLSCTFTGRSQATVWLTALDTEPLVRSRRMLFVHLTEGQNEGTVFADATCRKLLAWSGRLLVRDGTCRVALAVENASALSVWALATDGTRLEEVPTRIEDGRLAFVASVRGGDSAHLCYEIAESCRISAKGL